MLKIRLDRRFENCDIFHIVLHPSDHDVVDKTHIHILV